MLCPKCGAQNPDDAQSCRSCACVLTGASTSVGSPPAKTSGLAIAALVLAILTPFTCLLTFVPALVCGILALTSINKSAGRLKGKGLAVAGITVSSVSLPIVMALLMAILMPALSKTRVLALRVVCSANMHGIANAISMYAEDNGAFPTTSKWCDLLIENQNVDQKQFRCPPAPAGPANFAIKEKEWVGQYFTPVLPAEATQWKVTRVLVMARVHGAAKGIIAVQLRTAAAGNVPSATVLEEQLLNESSLGESYAWEEIPFTQVTGLAPGEGLCLVLGCNKKDSDLGDAQYDDGGGSGMLTTTSSGSTWNATTGKSLRFYVYGTLLTPVTPPPDITYWLRRINVSLQIGPDSAVRAETAARVLNEPEVTP